jgi:hypothetical protein
MIFISIKENFLQHANLVENGFNEITAAVFEIKNKAS